MKNTAKKLLTVMMVALMLSAVFGVYASAITAGEAAQKADEIFLDDIKGHIDWLNTKIKGLYESFADYMPLVFGALLLILSFFGYKLLKPLNLLGGLYLGFVVGLWLFAFLSEKMVMPGDFVKWILGGLLAIILGLLCAALNKASIVVFFTAYAFYFAANQLSDNLVVCVAVAALVLVLSIFLFKYVFVHILTLKCATFGIKQIFSAPLVANAIDFEKFFTIASRDTVVLYIGLLVAIFGILTQLKLARRKRR